MQYYACAIVRIPCMLQMSGGGGVANGMEGADM